VFWEAIWRVSDCHDAKQVIERRGKGAIDRLRLPTLTPP
jgi:hypothetical protein